MVAKDKVIIDMKNQNAKLMTKIVKIKGDYVVALQEPKSESVAMKDEIDKLKAQVIIKADKKIIRLEAKIASTKMTYDNLRKYHTSLHQIMKDYHKDVLEQMVEKLIALGELHKLKEWAKVDLQVEPIVVKI